MAVLTFPLTLAQFFDLLPISGCRIDMPDTLDVSETRSGELLTADVGESLWTGQIDMTEVLHAEAAAVKPLMNLLRRGGTSFLASDASRPWPRLDPNGAIIAGSTPTILALGASSRELSLAGLPVGYQISRGDLISFTYAASPTRYALHEFVGSGAANGSGQTALLEVTPPIRSGAVTGTAVQLVWPRCKAKLEPGSADTGMNVATITNNMTLRWRQTLR